MEYIGIHIDKNMPMIDIVSVIYNHYIDKKYLFLRSTTNKIINYLITSMYNLSRKRLRLTFNLRVGTFKHL